MRVAQHGVDMDSTRTSGPIDNCGAIERTRSIHVRPGCRVPHRAPASPLSNLFVLPLTDPPQRLFILHPIREQDPVQVIDLVLEDHGEVS